MLGESCINGSRYRLCDSLFNSSNQEFSLFIRETRNLMVEGEAGVGWGGGG